MVLLNFKTTEDRASHISATNDSKTPKVVRGGGLEPPQYCYRQDLNLVRLPISPPAQTNKIGGSGLGTQKPETITPHQKRSAFDFNLSASPFSVSKYSYVTQATIQGVTHYENFPVASILCPPRFRPAIVAIYWFARTADDIADEGDASAEQRLEALAAFRGDLSAVLAGHAPSQRWPQVFEPLAQAIRNFSLPAPLLEDLLDAFVQDVVKTRDQSAYANQDELLDYCKRSANPVGRLLLHLYGVQQPNALALSDDICSALQLINFWQDLSRDIPRGRHYLPTQGGEQHKIDQAELQNQVQSAQMSALIAKQTRLARAMMVRGSPLVKLIPGRAGWELRLVVQGGLRILDKIEAQQFATLRHRPRLRAWDVPLLLWRALWM